MWEDPHRLRWEGVFWSGRPALGNALSDVGERGQAFHCATAKRHWRLPVDGSRQQAAQAHPAVGMSAAAEAQFLLEEEITWHDLEHVQEVVQGWGRIEQVHRDALQAMLPECEHGMEYVVEGLDEHVI